MLDVFEVAALLVAHARKAYGQDVAIIAYYGSYATGSPSSRYSDLDMYYIPDDGQAASLYRSFVIQELPFEFWPVSWEFAQRIASGRHRWSVAPSIIANSQVIFSRSQEDLERFQALRAQIADLQKPENKPFLVAQALETFKTSTFHLYSLKVALARNDLLGARWAGCNLVDAVLDCLALVNQTFFAKSWASNLAQVLDLTIRPEKTEELIQEIVTSGDLASVLSSAEALVGETRALLIEEQKAIKKPFAPQGVFHGYYPAIKEYVNKVLAACEKRDLVAAGYVASKMQCELASTLAQIETGAECTDLNVYGDYGKHLAERQFPDLARCIADGDWAAIAEQAHLFDRRAQEYFTENSVDLNIAASIEDLQAFIEKPS